MRNYLLLFEGVRMIFFEVVRGWQQVAYSFDKFSNEVLLSLSITLL